jgi:branched-subunit amino acid ABC-type transport system permease component
MAELIVNQATSWLVLVSIYALLAIGFSLLFGVLDVIHFSHGDVSFLSAFLVLGLIAAATPLLGEAGPLATLGLVVLAVLGTGIIGGALYALVLRPFHARSQLMVLVATVALGIVIRQSVRHIVPQGSTAQPFPTMLTDTAFTVGGAGVSWFVPVTLLVTLAVMGGMYAILEHTLTGTRIRALAQDAEVAQLMGISTVRVAMLTFFLASSVGAVGGVFFAIEIGAIRFDYGVLFGLLGFSAAVIGGLGSVVGAIVGALIVGTVQTVAQIFLPSGPAYQQVVAFLVVIAFLVFRPSGLLGQKVVEKV